MVVVVVPLESFCSGLVKSSPRSTVSITLPSSAVGKVPKVKSTVVRERCAFMSKRLRLSLGKQYDIRKPGNPSRLKDYHMAVPGKARLSGF